MKIYSVTICLLWRPIEICVDGKVQVNWMFGEIPALLTQKMPNHYMSVETSKGQRTMRCLGVASAAAAEVVAYPCC